MRVRGRVRGRARGGEGEKRGRKGGERGERDGGGGTPSQPPYGGSARVRAHEAREITQLLTIWERAGTRMRTAAENGQNVILFRRAQIRDWMPHTSISIPISLESPVIRTLPQNF